MTSCDLLIFTSKGRAKILERSITSLSDHPNVDTYKRRILSLDGNDAEILKSPAAQWFTDIVVAIRQRGYYANIRNGLQAVRSPFFFWCEDDFELSSLPLLGDAFELFMTYPDLAQVRMYKDTELLIEQKGFGEIRPGIFGNRESYSFWPHFGRTELMREAIESIATEKNVNVEVAVSRWMRRRSAIFGVWEPKIRHASHFGHEVVGGHSDYATHLINEGISAGCKHHKGQNTIGLSGATYKPRSQLFTRSQNAVSFFWPLLYAPIAVLRCFLLSPFDRQSRAFIRRIWDYWHPDLRSPASSGESYLDEDKYD